MKIIYKEISLLNESEKNVLEELTKEYYQKLSNIIEIREMIIDVHPHSKGGKRKRYNAIIHILGPHNLDTNTEEWDLIPALHSAFKKLIKEAEHKLHK